MPTWRPRCSRVVAGRRPWLLVVAMLSTVVWSTSGASAQEVPSGARLGINGLVVGPNWDTAKYVSYLPDGRSAAVVDGLQFVFGAEFLSEHLLHGPSREGVHFSLPVDLEWS